MWNTIVWTAVVKKVDLFSIYNIWPFIYQVTSNTANVTYGLVTLCISLRFIVLQTRCTVLLEWKIADREEGRTYTCRHTRFHCYMYNKMRTSSEIIHYIGFVLENIWHWRHTAVCTFVFYICVVHLCSTLAIFFKKYILQHISTVCFDCKNIFRNTLRSCGKCTDVTVKLVNTHYKQR